MTALHHIRPAVFNSGYYEDMVQDVNNGRSIAIAIQTPKAHGGKSGKSPLLASHVALAAGTGILPSRVKIDGPSKSENPNRYYNDDAIHLDFLREPKEVTVNFGNLITPDIDDVAKYGGILQEEDVDVLGSPANKEQRRMLKRFGAEVLSLTYGQN